MAIISSMGWLDVGNFIFLVLCKLPTHQHSIEHLFFIHSWFNFDSTGSRYPRVLINRKYLACIYHCGICMPCLSLTRRIKNEKRSVINPFRFFSIATHQTNASLSLFLMNHSTSIAASWKEQFSRKSSKNDHFFFLSLAKCRFCSSSLTSADNYMHWGYLEFEAENCLKTTSLFFSVLFFVLARHSRVIFETLSSSSSSSSSDVKVCA